ncbi:MAG: hypothetical protein JO316_05340 [Abitibacteriaceae bacterium]|nr:hypothetical protein [Abditibacteriaceae bacterium]
MSKATQVAIWAGFTVSLVVAQARFGPSESYTTQLILSFAVPIGAIFLAKWMFQKNNKNQQ